MALTMTVLVTAVAHAQEEGFRTRRIDPLERARQSDPRSRDGIGIAGAQCDALGFFRELSRARMSGRRVSPGTRPF